MYGGMYLSKWLSWHKKLPCRLTRVGKKYCGFFIRKTKMMKLSIKYYVALSKVGGLWSDSNLYVYVWSFGKIPSIIPYRYNSGQTLCFTH